MPSELAALEVTRTATSMAEAEGDWSTDGARALPGGAPGLSSSIRENDRRSSEARVPALLARRASAMLVVGAPEVNSVVSNRAKPRGQLCVRPGVSIRPRQAASRAERPDDEPLSSSYHIRFFYFY
eukprot:scaffold22646_cov90-Isochrysis_galbana.AAC.1